MEGVSETPPKDIDPYTTLNLGPSATAAEVRIAYKTLALKHHPGQSIPEFDISLQSFIKTIHSLQVSIPFNHTTANSSADKAEASQKSTAHSTFQNIAFAYAILSSPHRRKLYDTTGSTSETLSNLSDDDDFNWLSFFRTQYCSLSASTLDDFSISYKNSNEECRDLLAAYEKHKGKLNGVYEEVMLSNPLEDEERFHGIIDKAIENGEVESFKAYTKESKASKDARMKRARREAEHAEHERRANAKYQSIFGGDGKGPNETSGANKENDIDVNNTEEPMSKWEKKTTRGHGDLGNLAAMIQSRNKARGATFFDDLEAKYAGTSAIDGGTKRKADDEPNEEAFQKTKAKMARAKAEREGKPGSKSKPTPGGCNAHAAAVKKDTKEEQDGQEDGDGDGDIDLGNKSADEEDELVEEEVMPKSKPKPKAKGQKGKAKKTAPSAAKRSTRSRGKK
ncbi:MAG: hypothetical protein Q9209_005392 [Squamulea sp. 1 TL-2023]